MKATRIIAALLILVFAVSAFASCSNNAKTIKVKLTVEAGDDRVFKQKVEVAEDEDGVSVIDVVKEAISKYPTAQENIGLDDAETSIKQVSVYKSGEVKGHRLYWTYTINGEEPQKGKASDNLVKDGDEIRYFLVYVEAVEGTEETITKEYTSDMNLYGELGEDEDEDVDETIEGEKTVEETEAE